MALKTVADIPTLTALYRASALHAAPSPTSAPSISLNARVGLIRGDITALPLDAIVNAANTSLLGGGGVDGAIHRAAGPALLSECRTLDGCKTGQAKITRGYELPAAHVIHTVGPVYNRYQPRQAEGLLRSCYAESLQVAVDNGVKTLAFSAISTGVYGFPSLDAAKVACSTVRSFLAGEKGGSIERVVFVTFEEKDVRAYNEIIP